MPRQDKQGAVPFKLTALTATDRGAEDLSLMRTEWEQDSIAAYLHSARLSLDCTAQLSVSFFSPPPRILGITGQSAVVFPNCEGLISPLLLKCLVWSSLISVNFTTQPPNQHPAPPLCPRLPHACTRTHMATARKWKSELRLTASFIPDGLNDFITINDKASTSRRFAARCSGSGRGPSPA